MVKNISHELMVLAGQATVDLPEQWESKHPVVEVETEYTLSLRSSIGERFMNAERRIHILQPIVNHPMMIPILLHMTQLQATTPEGQKQLNDEILAASELLHMEEAIKPLLQEAK